MAQFKESVFMPAFSPVDMRDDANEKPDPTEGERQTIIEEAATEARKRRAALEKSGFGGEQEKHSDYLSEQGDVRESLNQPKGDRVSDHV